MSTSVPRKQSFSVTGSGEAWHLDAVVLLGSVSSAVTKGDGSGGSDLLLLDPVTVPSQQRGEKGNAELVPSLQQAVEEIRRGLEKLRLVSTAKFAGHLRDSTRDTLRIEKAPESGEPEALREPLDVGMADFEVHFTSRDGASAPELRRPSVSVHFEHFTEGIVGPQKANRFGESLDFDLNVLWVAGWYRREPDDRKALIESIASDQEFQRKFGSDVEVRQWLAAMANALNGVANSVSAPRSQAMTLAEITRLFKSWNANRDTLRDQDGNALLDGLVPMNERTLVNRMMDLLLGKRQDNSTVFTDREAIHPEWIILNLLRHWSVVGRRGARGLAPFGPLIPLDILGKYIRYHP